MHHSSALGTVTACGSCSGHKEPEHSLITSTDRAGAKPIKELPSHVPVTAINMIVNALYLDAIQKDPRTHTSTVLYS